MAIILVALILADLILVKVTSKGSLNMDSLIAKQLEYQIWSVMKQKSKSKKQVAMLMSSNSPLTSEQKAKLRSEIKSGEVKVTED